MGVRQRTLAGGVARAWALPGWCPGVYLAVAGTVMRAARRQYDADGGRRLLWRGQSGDQVVSAVRRPPWG